MSNDYLFYGLELKNRNTTAKPVLGYRPRSAPPSPPPASKPPNPAFKWALRVRPMRIGLRYIGD